MSSDKHIIAVTMGDPDGIGPDIVLKAWANKEQSPIPPHYIIGSKKVLTSRASQLAISVDLIDYQSEAKKSDCLQVKEVTSDSPSDLEQPTPYSAHQTISSIEQAVHDVHSGEASSVVTCPINKHVLYNAGFTFPGHTEFLAALASKEYGDDYHPVMMLSGPQLRTVPVTIHIPLKQVFECLTTQEIVTVGEITHRELQKKFGIAAPRLAVSGLNPHAGEARSLGDEDEDIVLPAVKSLQSKGIDAVGPLPADTMFHERARENYDVAICMYHDQALIPAKTLGFDDAVNVTLGLPFVRTSPDHGTAYDIAGTGKANPSSYIAALRMAAEMTNHHGR